MNEPRHPLCWPTGWPRTQSYARNPSKFLRSYSQAGTGSRQHSMAEGASLLSAELERLGATSAILSTNVEMRLDNTPRSNTAKPADPGVAVYFNLKGKRLVLACDKWNRVEDNVWAIAKHVEAIRGQNRWGVGSVEQAFSGYAALPAPETPGNAPWWQILGVDLHTVTEVQLEAAYRNAAKKAHPDSGGSHNQMVAVNAAYELGRKKFGG